MSAGFEYVILESQRVQSPQVPVESNSCGLRANETNERVADIAILSDALNSKREESEILSREYLLHPSASDIDPGERLSKNVSILEQSSFDWAPRFQMVKKAFQDRTPQESVYSLSIVPTDPTERQTVYIKKGRIPRPGGLLPEGCSSMILNHTNTYRDESNEPLSNKFMGYIKPYDTYSNRDFKPNIDPAHIPSSYTIYTMDEAREIQGIASGIVQEFKHDVHAKAIGLIILDQAQGNINRLYVYKE